MTKAGEAWRGAVTQAKYHAFLTLGIDVPAGLKGREPRIDADGRGFGRVNVECTIRPVARKSTRSDDRGKLKPHGVTRRSNRDRDIFLALLNAPDAKPNKALIAAAKKHKKRMG